MGERLRVFPARVVFAFAFLRAVLAMVALAGILLESGAGTRAFAQAPARGATPLNAGTGDTTKSFSASYALVIGIDAYGGGWPKLSKAREDARAVAAALRKGGFNEVDERFDLDSSGLERALKDFIYRKGSDPDARLLVWFAGHGHTIGGEGYLVPVDAPMPGKDPASEAAFQSVAMPLASFGRYMTEVKARHVMAIFDSCFSGSVFNATRSSVPASVAKSSAQLARQFIASGSAGEEALDDGAFRAAFVAALEGQQRGALSDEGYLTGSRLGAYLAETISRATKGRQNPIYSTSNVVGLDRGDFLFPASFPQTAVPPAPGTIEAAVPVPVPLPNLSGPPAPELRMEKVEWSSSDPEIGILADKIARNLVEYYSNNKLYVSSALTGREAERPPSHFIRARVSGIGDQVQFDLDLVRRSGETIATASFGGPKSFYLDYYKVLPQTIQYMFDTSLRTLEPLHSSNRATENGEAYALFLAARQRASRNQFDQAQKLIEQAIEVDDAFAQAYAAYAQLARQLGQPPDVYDDYMRRASAIDADYSQLSVFADHQLGDPVPALREVALSTPWSPAGPGLEFRRIETPDYGTSILAWRYDQSKLSLKLVKSRTSRGETVAEFRERTNAVLAINAGFFDLDMASRLTPVGLLVVDGRELNAFDAMKAKNPLSGLLYSKNGEVGVMWSRDFTSVGGFESALQTGPFVVDPGGKNGIYRNNFDRQNRSVVCLDHQGRPSIVQVGGGLSLYEVGEILSTAEADGGLGCERALNLDGGPSSQVSMMAEGTSLEVPGLWRISSSLVLLPKQ